MDLNDTHLNSTTVFLVHILRTKNLKRQLIYFFVEIKVLRMLIIQIIPLKIGHKEDLKNLNL